MNYRLSLACVALSATMLVAGCAADKGAADESADNGSAASGASAVKDAKAALPALQKGTSVLPGDTSRPIKKGARVALLSAGQNNLSAQGPIDSAKAACKVAGWTCDVFDGASDHTKFSGLVNQIVAANYDGIIDVAVDCPLISSALKAAKKKGIKVVGAYAYDCSDPKYKGEKQFDGEVLYLDDRTAAEQYVAFGRAQATAILALTGGHQKILHVKDSEFRILDYIAEGLEAGLAKDPSTSIIQTLDIKAADLATGKAAQQISSLLTKSADATAITTPYFAAGMAAVYPSLQATGKSGKLFVQGAEGQAPELDMVRGDVASFVNIASPEWTGWAAVDTMNSILTDKPVVSSGIGFTIVTKDNAPGKKGSTFSDLPDYQSAYRKAWDIS
ncbi:MAG: ribose transport system substrate-binding protein [Nocardioidaceae bacterium]|jgi:ribose transport system substrate-binding protein|nr:ribose transport system substrate-binding protein [Nocardioidaceae bacterium]